MMVTSNSATTTAFSSECNSERGSKRSHNCNLSDGGNGSAIESVKMTKIGDVHSSYLSQESESSDSEGINFLAKFKDNSDRLENGLVDAKFQTHQKNRQRP